ncbi:MAG: DNA processing protein DprA, partial [Cellulomonadaceae bacterium]|nr:DNA processing protein DprA [Cellulomonadaceae bacterium]
MSAVMEERAARAAWSALVEPGDPVAGALVTALGAGPALDWVRRWVREPGSFAAQGWLELEEQRGEIEPTGRQQVGRALDRWAPRLARTTDDALTGALDLAPRAGARVVVPGDPEWPSGLEALGPSAPLCLWVRGAVPDLSRSVAVVGARA